MQQGICLLSIVPIRKEPTSTSEMISQLLFGNTFTIHKNAGEWLAITTTDDNYSGFVSSKQVVIDVENNYNWKVNQAFPYLSLNTNNGSILAPTGCLVPTQNSFTINKTTFNYTSFESASQLNLEQIALHYINAPYLWGGKTAFGIDCSGFTQMVYKQINVNLNRDAYQQAEMGETVAFVDETKVGDLAFFDNDEGRITHVGIMLNNQQIIHASGKVRIDMLDHHGIFDAENKQYSHKLRIIKRII